MRSRLLRPAVIVPTVLLAVALLAVGMFLFQPWKLFTNVTVNEPVPAAASVRASVVTSTPSSSATPASDESSDEPIVLAEGSFVTHEHATTGKARVLQLPDGSRVLRLEDLDTSNGPDLKVWLSDAPVIDGKSGWFVFDDGSYEDLGSLKGNRGSQNYPIPADVDLAELTSVAIWCDRFSVSFGAAELTAST